LIDWLNERINTISMIGKYEKPEETSTYKLDANENLLLDRNLLSQIVIKEAKKIDLRKYPFEQYYNLLKKLSSYLNVDSKSLVIGNGSDQIIDLLLSIIGRGKRITLFTPTFSYFISRCHLHGLRVNKIPLRSKDNTIRKKSFLNSAKRSEVVYLCSPNNPTSNQIEKSVVQEILQLKNVLVILDEAYVEFAKYSMTSLIDKYDNLAILRTFSKAFGLAGCRLGYAVTNENFADFFRSNVQSPYPVSSLSLVVAKSLLSNLSVIRNSIEIIKKERQRLLESISEIQSLATYPSDSNFVFVRVKHRYEHIINALLRHGISVKILGNLSTYGNCLRITVGTPKMNNVTISALKSA
jgi:histidinol-phosphate aminotransferase